MAELAERLGLDLANALAGHREALADLLERVLALVADAEPEAQDLLFLGRERAEGALHLVRQVLADQAVVRRFRALVLEEVAQLRVLADRGLERERLARGLEDEPDLAGGYTGLLGQLLGRGLATHLVDEGAVDARDAIERLDHVHRDADRARMVGDGPRDGLADPPGGIGRKLEPAPILEAIDRLHEADIAFLDEVEQRQLAA